MSELIESRDMIRPICLSADICFNEFGSYGWVWTKGLKGEVNWSGLLVGLVPGKDIAIKGFTGINILTEKANDKHYYFGFARHVKIEEVKE